MAGARKKPAKKHKKAAWIRDYEAHRGDDVSKWPSSRMLTGKRPKDGKWKGFEGWDNSGSSKDYPRGGHRTSPRTTRELRIYGRFLARQKGWSDKRRDAWIADRMDWLQPHERTNVVSGSHPDSGWKVAGPKKRSAAKKTSAPKRSTPKKAAPAKRRTVKKAAAPRRKR